MSDIVLFHMWSGHRAHLLEKHQFYVSQARGRLLEQFTDDAISTEADKAAEEALQRRAQLFDPERSDPGELEEAAYDDGVWQYQLLTDLRDSVRLSIISGFFHEWEKILRQWLVGEVGHWHFGNEAKSAIWKANLADLVELLNSFGWDLRASPYYQELDACRLVVNVYKHGDGPSLDELASKYPYLLDHPFGDIGGQIGGMGFSLSHEYLKVTDGHLNAFSGSILRFWEDVPENVFDSQLTAPPGWLQKAIEKDQLDERKAVTQ
jgi:hypothetical protein